MHASSAHVMISLIRKIIIANIGMMIMCISVYQFSRECTPDHHMHASSAHVTISLIIYLLIIANIGMMIMVNFSIYQFSRECIPDHHMHA